MLQRARWRVAAVAYVGVLAAVCGFSAVSLTGSSRAEEAGKEKETAAAKTDAVEAPAEPAATGTAEVPPAAKKSVLAWYYEALGLSYSSVFLFLSFTAVALAVMCSLSARRDAICPVALAEAFESHVQQGHYQDAYELVRQDESLLGQVLAAGLGKLSSGYDRAAEAMQEVGEDENMKLEHRLSYLALIATISPMIGLFGTVDGMVRSFYVIATSNTTPKPSKLAEGISTALITTIVGLAIAIPAIAAYNILKNITMRRVLEVGIVSEGLMRTAAESAKKK